jgi:hypothetical protein
MFVSLFRACGVFDKREGKSGGAEAVDPDSLAKIEALSAQ